MRRQGPLAGLVLAAAIVAGVSHLVPTALESTGPLVVLWKGAGVGLLAVYAGLRARSLDAWLLALVMAFGAAGDVLIDTVSFEAGALAFLGGHLVAIVLYLRNRRPARSAVGRVLAALGVLVVVGVGVLGWVLVGSVGIAVYAAALFAMAVTATASRFPRLLTALGAWLFVASDVLIFLRSGVLSGSVPAAVATWALYFPAQVMIVLGVARVLTRSARSTDRGGSARR